MNALPWTIYLSFAGAAAALVAGTRSAQAARWTALIAAAASWFVTLTVAFNFTPTQGLQTIVEIPWISELGIRYHLAADGISLTLLVLTAWSLAAAKPSAKPVL